MRSLVGRRHAIALEHEHDVHPPHNGIIPQSRVRIGGQLSREVHIARGLRQGDPLSCLLFDLYLNDILDDDTRMEYGVPVPGLPDVHILDLLYADDIALLCASEADAQAVLDTIERWADDNEVAFNLRKSGFLAIRADGSSSAARPPMPITLQRGRIPIVPAYRYLGGDGG